MAITIEAVYENSVLRPLQPLTSPSSRAKSSSGQGSRSFTLWSAVRKRRRLLFSLL